MLRATCEHRDARLPSEHAGAKEYGCTHSKWTSVHDLRQHEVAWARPVRVVRLAPMRSLDLRGRVRSLGVNLSLWFTAAQLMYLRGYHLRQRHSNFTEVMEGTILDHSRRGGADRRKRTRR